MNYIQKGIDEGATLLSGGVGMPDKLTKGFFVKPTVFKDVTPEMTIWKEEIFGPVLVITTYEDEREALELANDSIYGLSGGVWSKDEERAIKFARNMRTGQISINGGFFNVSAPFGGFKASGNGRELGIHGLEEFLEINQSRGRKLIDYFPSHKASFLCKNAFTPISLSSVSNNATNSDLSVSMPSEKGKSREALIVLFATFMV